MKKVATLLPNNWLAETPQTLGRQSAGSGFLKSIGTFFKEKNCKQTRFSNLSTV
ncbi:hypothetical protein [Peribacillus simplex]|uniref:hypothetical protein n=1 Tax=Peribacillus simplex TaxID=1478 RepID=UPI0016263C25|nr:hypothetical protein [Peribacillus simplex]